MDSFLTEEQRAFAAAIADFAKRECGTREQRDLLTDGGRQQHSEQIAKQIGDLGWFGVMLPEEYGGAGQGQLDLCVLMEGMARGLIPAAGFAVSSVAAVAFLKFGTEQQKQSVLPDIIKGRVVSISMSEPGAGSDVGAIQCRADKVDGGFVINGQKTWCSEAHIADRILLVARTNREGDKHDGLTMFSVPTDSPGLEIRPIDTMGGQIVNDLFFTDCFLPEAEVVGEVDRAWPQLMAELNPERLGIAAHALGQAQRAFDDALAYVKQRKQFGRPVGSFQTIKHRLADLATEIECTRLLVYDTARKVDGNPEVLLPREASMAKLKATTVAKQVALEGMQMMGGYGYATEFDMEGLVRTALLGPIVGGTSEIQRDIIGATFGL